MLHDAITPPKGDSSSQSKNNPFTGEFICCENILKGIILKSLDVVPDIRGFIFLLYIFNYKFIMSQAEL